MTILANQIKAAEKLGGKHLATTTIWNHHNASIQSCNTQAFKLATNLVEQGKAKYIVGIIGAKGRSQHSATDVNLFSFDKFDEEAFADLTSYSNSNDCGIWGVNS